jgi:hypothetical protein
MTSHIGWPWVLRADKHPHILMFSPYFWTFWLAAPLRLSASLFPPTGLLHFQSDSFSHQYQSIPKFYI